MSTERLYYHDAYATTFEANIVERIREDDQLAVVLDKTCFYPTSGGQPADRGQLNGRAVTDVYVREEDDAIVHVLAQEVWDDEVKGAVEWGRRFDHMQQHTGQHILSQAFISVADAHTVGFHLSDSTVTIDLNRANLSPANIEKAELLANRIIWENRPVKVRLVTQEQVQQLPLRKIPELNAQQYRLVEIEKFDLTACGGTHVSRTGAVGLIKIVKVERRGEQLRVEFCAGRRALADYGQKHRLVSQLAADFTTGYWKLPEVIATLRSEAADNERLLRQQTEKLLAYEARDLLANARSVASTRIVTAAFSDRDPAHLPILANHVIAEPGVVALLGLAGAKSRLLFARSDDAPGQMNSLLKQALHVLGNGGGGGSETFAQGGGPAAPIERVEQALQRTEKHFLGQLI